MIYWLLYPLSEEPGLGFLNVLRYVPFRVLAATMTAMLLTFGLYPWFIRRLQSRQIGQVVRKEGPQSHLSKAGTPTMGGALILLALVMSTVLWADPTSTPVWLTLAVTVAYGVVGYIDDAQKLRRKSSGGLSARGKLVLQFGVAFLVCGYLWYGEAGLGADWLRIRGHLAVPFYAYAAEDYALVLPSWAYVLFASFVLVATSNCVNLTDGLDGLAIGPVMINAGTYAILAYLAGVTFFTYDLADYLRIPSIASASMIEMIQKRTITFGSGQPFFSKWWWMGAIRKMRFLKRRKLVTWPMTLTPSTTNTPPSSTERNSFLVRIASIPSPPPSASDPTSPMKTWAG